MTQIINEDFTGRSRLVRNVGASYAGHFVFIIFGFIMPRAIDEQIGQVALGIWDFSWSFVNYLNLAMLGIGSSVNRYVARYRAAGDTLALNRTLSSVVAVQIVIAVLVFGASMVLAVVVPAQFAERLGTFGPSTAWVIGLLGSSLAVQMAFDAWRGVLTGCHRWGYYNALNAGGYAISALTMLMVLFLGGGLQELAWVYFSVTVATEIARFVLAKRVCPEVRLLVSHVNARDAKKVIRFGLKTLLTALSAILTIQTVNVVLVAKLGPAALAVLARPLALAMHISSLASKYSFVLTPAAGSLQRQNRTAELREFALDSARSGWLIAIPPLTFLFVIGDLIIDVWMGPGYSEWTTSAVLAAGFLLPISQGPVLKIMVGLDEHGAIAKTGVVVTLVLLTAGLFVLNQIGWSVTRAAGLIAIPAGVGIGIVIFYYAIRYLDIGLVEYFRAVLRDGVVLLVVLTAVLVANRWISPFSPLWTVLTSAVLTALTFYLLRREDIHRIIKALRKKDTPPED
jgi:O-antigen/teichoic acid export membrane protein